MARPAGRAQNALKRAPALRVAAWPGTQRKTMTHVSETTPVTDQDIYLFREGTHAQLYGSSAAIWIRRRGFRGVGAERARSIGDRRLERLAARRARACSRAGTTRASGKAYVAGVDARAAPTSTASPRAHGARRGQGRSVRVLLRDAAGAPRRAPGRSSTSGTTPRGCARARRAQRARRADVDLRGAPGLVAPRASDAHARATARSPQPLAEYVARDGLHARRADADHRASVLRLVGLPDHRLLRADRALRHAAGLHVPGRHAAPARHRRDPRLGAVALSRRRARPRAASTARISTSTPIRARASTPSGTAASSTTAATRCARSCCRARCSGSSATTSTACASTRSPRCSTSTTRARRASGSRTRTAARRTSRRSSSCAQLNDAVYRDYPDVQTIAEESTAWPHGVAARCTRGGLGFGMKWNMGWMHDTLDYMSRTTRSTASYHHERAHLLASGTRSPRTSCCRCRTTRWCTARARCSARCPATTGSSSPTCALLFGYMWAHPGKKLLFMGGEFGQRREWNHDGELDWHLLRARRRTPACSAGCATSTASTAREPALHEQRLRRRRASSGSTATTASNSVLAFLRRAATRPRPVLVALQLHAGAARRTTASACRAAAAGSEMLNSDARDLRRQRRRQPRRRRGRADRRAHGRYHSLALTLPPLGACCSSIATRQRACRAPAGAVTIAGGDGRAARRRSRTSPRGRRRALRGQARRRRDASRSRPTASPTATTLVACVLRYRAATASSVARSADGAARQRPLARRVRRSTALGRWRYTVVGVGRPLRLLARRASRAASTPRTSALARAVGAELVRGCRRARARGATRERSADWAQRLRAHARPTRERCARSRSTSELVDARRAAPRPPLATRSPASSPRRRSTASARASAPGTSSSRARAAGSRDATARSPTATSASTYVAAMGFDVVYLPPIHPIGRDHRKGRNNALDAEPDDVGSPWAIGARRGRPHGDPSRSSARSTISAASSTAAQRARHRDRARHRVPVLARPSVGRTSIREWFRKRPDGTIQYAENPPKKYQDIYPFDFETRRLAGAVGRAARASFDFWIDARRARSSASTTRTPSRSPFWEWVIAEVKREHPDVIFLAEAFTRPKVMHRLAKLGFTQSYTYFTWRNTKQELTEYFTELDAGAGARVLPPELLAEHAGHPAPSTCSTAAAPAFMRAPGAGGDARRQLRHLRPGVRAAASTGRASRAREEYLDSEKYQLRHWDLTRADSLRAVHRAR